MVNGLGVKCILTTEFTPYFDRRTKAQSGKRKDIYPGIAYIFGEHIFFKDFSFPCYLLALVLG